MRQDHTIAPNGESAKEVQKYSDLLTPKQSPRASRASANRYSADYWRKRVYRPKYSRGGQVFRVAQFWVQIKHGGQRHAVALGVNDADSAARQALKLYKTLKQSGWEGGFRLFRPAAEPTTTKELTVGHYLSLVDQHAPLPPRTFSDYAYAIRRIASDIARVSPAVGKSRFDPKGLWREAADSVPLRIITPTAADDWRLRFRKERGGDPIRDQRAARSANSYIRNARSLFSRRILDAMRKHDVALPDPLPFAGVRLDGKTGSTRYRSTIEAGTLLQAARSQLAQADPDAYAVILLALGAGLRRSEIDGMQWPAVMPEKGIIRVMTTAQRRVKSDESEGDVHVDPALFAELQSTRRPGVTLFVVEPDTPHPRSKAAHLYRAQETLVRVTTWLRDHGVLTSKPLHTLRKEFGSVVAAAGDIHQAQRQLRHAHISTTEAFYADARARATVPVGSLLQPRPATTNRQG